MTCAYMCIYILYKGTFTPRPPQLPGCVQAETVQGMHALFNA